MTAPVDVLAVLDATILAAEADARMYKLDDAAKAVAVFKATRAAVAELITSHAALLETAERLDPTEGYCCCGDDMQRHADPMSCGHSPVDAGSYYHGQTLDRARAALARVQGVQS